MDLTQTKAVIFDKDGTLFDFAATWQAWVHAVIARLCDTDAQADRLGRSIGYDFSEKRFEPDSVVIAGTPGEIVDSMLPHLPGKDRSDVLNLLNEEAGCAPQVPAVPLGPFLEVLRGRALKLGVVTNDAEAPARIHLEQAGILNSFDFIAGYDSGFGAKPGPGQLLACAEAFGVAPRNVVMVGDSLHDLLAARAAGMPGIGVLTGLAAAEELAPHAVGVLPDIGHLPEWLDAAQAAQF